LEKVQLREDYAKYIDIVDGIDFVLGKKNDIMTVQERFLVKQYQTFNDFKIRYQRYLNNIVDRFESEYYIKSSLFYL